MHSYLARTGGLYLILFFAFLNVYSQSSKDLTLTLTSERLILDLGLLDNILIVNSQDENLRISVENSGMIPALKTKESEGIFYFSSVFQEDVTERSSEAKQCSIEPVYPTYKISIPAGKTTLVSYKSGNFLADGFDGILQLELEDGMVRMVNTQNSVHVKMQRGKAYIEGISDSNIDVRTRIGELHSNIRAEALAEPGKQSEFAGKSLLLRDERFEKEIVVEAVMANIYLNP